MFKYWNVSELTCIETTDFQRIHEGFASDDGDAAAEHEQLVVRHHQDHHRHFRGLQLSRPRPPGTRRQLHLQFWTGAKEYAIVFLPIYFVT
jgi:hypothetical protein